PLSLSEKNMNKYLRKKLRLLIEFKVVSLMLYVNSALIIFRFIYALRELFLFFTLYFHFICAFVYFALIRCFTSTLLYGTL
ncbi:MAG TPA: hypothetical protein DCW98_03155, partial [Bacteroidales bacterium]|nr:hypothetical protein [Bacteroidales bacterium]